MERVNIVVLASLAAALTLVGLRLWSYRGEPDLSAAPAVALGSAFSPDGLRDRRLPPSRIAINGGSRRAADQPEPGATPSVEEKRRPRSAADAERQSADLVTGTERRRALLERRGDAGFAASDTLDGEVSDRMPSSLTGAVPRAAAGHENNPAQLDPNQRHTFDFVDDPPKDAGGPDVLLKIPFKGAVDAEIGGGSIQADGLVTTGGDVQFPDNAQLSFPAGGNVNSSGGTISFEVQPQWAGADETNNSLVQIHNEHVWENALSIVKNFGALRFIIIDSVGVERNVNIPIGDWPAGEPQRVTATWGDAAMALYINGELVGQNTLANPLSFADSTPVHIGSDFPGGAYVGAGGTIRDFTVYARALGANEISQ